MHTADEEDGGVERGATPDAGVNVASREFRKVVEPGVPIRSRVELISLIARTRVRDWRNYRD